MIKVRTHINRGPIYSGIFSQSEKRNMRRPIENITPINEATYNINRMYTTYIHIYKYIPIYIHT